MCVQVLDALIKRQVLDALIKRESTACRVCCRLVRKEGGVTVTKRAGG